MWGDERLGMLWVRGEGRTCRGSLAASEETYSKTESAEPTHKVHKSRFNDSWNWVPTLQSLLTLNKISINQKWISLSKGSYKYSSRISFYILRSAKYNFWISTNYYVLLRLHYCLIIKLVVDSSNMSHQPPHLPSPLLFVWCAGDTTSRAHETTV